MPNNTPTVDSLAELCGALAYDEVFEIMGGPQHIGMDDPTACEMVALLTILRPVRERRAAAQGSRRLCLRWCPEQYRRTESAPPA
jgi:hypothetical protein